MANELIPVESTRPEDIFLCGFPRSGNTWMQNLVAGVVYGLDPHLIPDSLIQDLVPDVHYKTMYKRYGDFTVFKCHNLPAEGMRRVVYLLRDGRDVMASYKEFSSALGDDSDYLNFVQGESLFPCRWHEHVEAWMNNPYQAEMLWIRYEDLLESTVDELKRFCEFANLEREIDLLKRVALQSKFDKAQIKERESGWDNKAWPKDRKFVRRGIQGSYRDEMPGPVLEAFMDMAGATLARCGYLE